MIQTGCVPRKLHIITSKPVMFDDCFSQIKTDRNIFWTNWNIEYHKITNHVLKKYSLGGSFYELPNIVLSLLIMNIKIDIYIYRISKLQSVYFEFQGG